MQNDKNIFSRMKPKHAHTAHDVTMQLLYSIADSGTFQDP